MSKKSRPCFYENITKLYMKKMLTLNNSTINTLKKRKFELDIINDFLPIQSFYLRVFNYETVMIF